MNNSVLLTRMHDRVASDKEDVTCPRLLVHLPC